MPESFDHLSVRKDEILALSSIYDELVLNSDGLSGFLVIPVELDSHIPVASPEAHGQARFLPGIEFTFSTGEDYPEGTPPEISLRCSWLPNESLATVTEEIKALWEGELCIFTMIDELFERAKVVFGLEYLELTTEFFDDIVKFAESEELKRFNDGSYFCGICLENKKGIECFKLPLCGHVSCKVSL